MRDDPFLTESRAEFLAEHLGVAKDGGIVWNSDPWHKAPGPYLLRLEESMAVWRQMTAPVLWVAGKDSWVEKEFATRPGNWEARRGCFGRVEEAWVEEAWIERAGHMLHHDQPGEVGRLVEAFWTSSPD